jgi:glycosyltransferase involved in cell wall biosynthesis
MNSAKVIIVVQQETLRERPRIHKLGRILQGLGQEFEIWKFGPAGESAAEGMCVHNLLSGSWRQRPAVLRYLAWMLMVFKSALLTSGARHFVAVGFDSAFPLAVLPSGSRSYIFDNIDNVSMSYRWPIGLKSVFRFLERRVAHRAAVHINPSKVRWPYDDPNLQVVVNTPSWAALEAAKHIADQLAYQRGSGTFTIYLNGWLSATRGLRTLIEALKKLMDRNIDVKVVAAGRAACPDAVELLALANVEHLGMLTNDEALAVYFRTDLAFIYYDPALEINRLAESQKWTDCWSTGTAFVSNSEVLTLSKFREAEACFALQYADSEALATLIETLATNPGSTSTIVHRLQGMKFQYWDDQVRDILLRWVTESGLAS